MKVLKFGGTSVGKPERMHSIANLIKGNDKKLIVLSAVSGTTNALVAISEALSANDSEKGMKLIDELFKPYFNFVDQLFSTTEAKKNGQKIIDIHYEFVKSFLNKSFGEKETKIILAEGELISTALFQEYLLEIGYKSVLLPALDFMKIDEDNEPVLTHIEDKLNPIIAKHTDAQYFITQGFIARNSNGEIDNLKRGGSDYTASLVGAAIRAEEVQIWTDIDGMHNNDPRIVKNTFPIAALTFDEAAELAYFGAKILHPSTILPAKKYAIPVRLLNTMQPEAKGTVIADQTSDRDIKAIAAKDNLIAIKIKSTRMLLAYGFLRRVFEVFEKYKTPIDMITTSEVAVSVTIDDDKNLINILEELKSFCTVEVDKNQTIVCIVGDFLEDKPGLVKKIFDALKAIPIRMISYGGSKNNVSVLINTQHKNDALNALNEGVF
ncbi:MAG: aspartate kinase [Cytophagales bacterium]|nr:MAG: aspartate kinase [Cytophagales bacterium]